MSNFPGGPFYYQFEGKRSRPTIEFDQYGYQHDPSGSVNYNSNRRRVGPKEGVPIVSDFDDNTVVIGRPDRVNDVQIYNYTKTSNTWSSATVLSNPGTTSSEFGYALSMNWDGDRLVVGSPGDNKVYVYDKNASTGVWSYGSNVITGSTTTGVEFGGSVSIAQNTSTTLCVGAPGSGSGGSSVFVYEYDSINCVWSQTFSNTSVDVDMTIPISSSSSLIVNNNLSRYGHSVYMSYNGEHFIAGAPGTQNIHQLDSTNTTGSPYSWDNRAGGLLYTFGYYQYTSNYDVFANQMPVSTFDPNGFPGWVRVFTRGSYSTWQGNTTQLGQLIRGNNEWTLEERAYLSADTQGFGWSRCGWDVAITKTNENSSYDNNIRIAVSSPGQPGLNKNLTYSTQSGVVDTYVYNSVSQTWVSESKLYGNQRRDEYGNSVALDYTGTRIAISTRGQSLSHHYLSPGYRLENSKVSILEWNGDSWWEASPTIYLNGSSYPSTVNDGTGVDNVQVTMTNGKNIFVSSSLYGNVYAQNVSLTQQFIGNSLFEGYIAANRIYVGSNDATENSTSTKGTKTIEFGGFYGDASYELTAIENRLYEESPGAGQDTIGNFEGRSELLISKLSEKFGIDAIRMVAGETLFGSTTSPFGSIFRRKTIHPLNGSTSTLSWNTNPYWYENFEFDKYDRQTSVLGIDNRQHVVINPNMTRPVYLYNSGAYDMSPDDSMDPGSFYGNADLDVGGDCCVRSNLIISDVDAIQTKGYGREAPTLGFDTRNFDILNVGVTPNQVRMMPFKSTRHDSQTRLRQDFGTLHGTISLDKAKKAFSFGDTGSSYVDCVQFQGSNNSGQRTGVSFWIRFDDVNNFGTTGATYHGKYTVPEGGTSSVSQFPGIVINPESAIVWENANIACLFSKTNGFVIIINLGQWGLLASQTPAVGGWENQPSYVANRWYHVVMTFPGGADETSGAIPNSLNCELHIDNVKMVRSFPIGSNQSSYQFIGGTNTHEVYWSGGGRFRLGSATQSIRNVYIGMLAVYIGFSQKSQTPLVADLFNNGSPQTTLRVSGSASINEGNLMIKDGGIFQNGHVVLANDRRDLYADNINFTGSLYQNGTVWSPGANSTGLDSTVGIVSRPNIVQLANGPRAEPTSTTQYESDSNSMWENTYVTCGYVYSWKTNNKDVHIFKRTDTTMNDWVLDQTIPYPNSYFYLPDGTKILPRGHGTKIVLYKNTLAIGAPGTVIYESDNNRYSWQGAVAIYGRTGPTTQFNFVEWLLPKCKGIWGGAANGVPRGGIGDNACYGKSIDIHENSIVIGAPFASVVQDDDYNHGRVGKPIHGFYTSTGITDIDSSTKTYAGITCISRDGSHLVVGAPGYTHTTTTTGGQVRVFTLGNNGAGDWVKKGQSLYGGVTGDEFGGSVACSENGTRIVCGGGCVWEARPHKDGIWADVSGNLTTYSTTGFVRVYDWDSTTNSWIQNGSFSGNANEFLGVSVSMSDDGTRFIAGGYGSIRIYEWNTSTNSWSNTNFSKTPQANLFGYDVAMSGDGTTAVVGTPNSDPLYSYGTYSNYSSSDMLPPVMTSTAQSGYVISGHVAASDIVNAFDRNAGTNYSGSGAYPLSSQFSSTNYQRRTPPSTTFAAYPITWTGAGTYNGAWVQIQLPSAQQVEGIIFRPTGTETIPNEIRLLGSNDGTNWNVVFSTDDTITASGSHNAMNPVVIIFNQPSASYLFYTFIWEEIPRTGNYLPRLSSFNVIKYTGSGGGGGGVALGDSEVSIYQRDTSTYQWSQTHTFPTSVGGTRLGISVAISQNGGRIAAGEPEYGSGTDKDGRVRVWQDNGSGVYSYLYNNTNSDHAQSLTGTGSAFDTNGYFGSYVGLSSDGNILAVGSRNAQAPHGQTFGIIRKYIYNSTYQYGARWEIGVNYIHEYGDDGYPGNSGVFGDGSNMTSLAGDGTRLAMGDIVHNTSKPSSRVYVRDDIPVSGVPTISAWSMYPIYTKTYGTFGINVRDGGNGCIEFWYRDTVDDATSTWTRTSEFYNTEQMSDIHNSYMTSVYENQYRTNVNSRYDRCYGPLFGNSVSIDGDTAVVSAPRSSLGSTGGGNWLNYMRGAVFIYRRTTPGDNTSTWTQLTQAEYLPLNATSNAATANTRYYQDRLHAGTTVTTSGSPYNVARNTTSTTNSTTLGNQFDPDQRTFPVLGYKSSYDEFESKASLKQASPMNFGANCIVRGDFIYVVCPNWVDTSGSWEASFSDSTWPGYVDANFYGNASNKFSTVILIYKRITSGDSTSAYQYHDALWPQKGQSEFDRFVEWWHPFTWVGGGYGLSTNFPDSNGYRYDHGYHQLDVNRENSVMFFSLPHNQAKRQMYPAPNASISWPGSYMDNGSRSKVMIWTRDPSDDNNKFSLARYQGTSAGPIFDGLGLGPSVWSNRIMYGYRYTDPATNLKGLTILYDTSDATGVIGTFIADRIKVMNPIGQYKYFSADSTPMTLNSTSVLSIISVNITPAIRRISVYAQFDVKFASSGDRFDFQLYRGDTPLGNKLRYDAYYEYGRGETQYIYWVDTAVPLHNPISYHLKGYVSQGTATIGEHGISIHVQEIA